jgi:CRP-like cAMP-binding protein
VIFVNKFSWKNFNINFYQDLIQILHLKSHPYYKKKFHNQQIICMMHSRCETIGIIINGSVNIEHTLEDGKKIIINQLYQYDIFGEILIFSDEQNYPYSIVANQETEILFIHKTILLTALSEDKDLLEQFLNHVSKSYMKINKYVKLMSQKQILNKIAFYLIHYQGIDSSNLTCRLTTKTEMADFLGIERQSLIRELNHLKNKQVIDYNKDYIYIKNLAYLENLVK